MSDETPQKRSLSEISHLFLSSVRDRQTGGFQRPLRTPPQPRTDVSIDLTPEEFAQVLGGSADDLGALPSDVDSTNPIYRAPGISAILGAHLNGRQFDRVKEYARSLAARVGRIGLIEVDSSEFRLMCFDPSATDWPQAERADAVECFDPRQMAEAMSEMNCDVNHWLLLISNPRLPEAKALLRDVSRWVLLSTCDHDGVVSSYRLLKGLSEITSDSADTRPGLSLALLDGNDDSETTRVFRKLSGVCEQFLSWPLEHEPPVSPAARVAEHLMMFCRPTRDKGQMATAPQWTVVGEFVARLKQESSQVQPTRASRANLPPHGGATQTPDAQAIAALEAPPQIVADFVIPTPLMPSQQSSAVAGTPTSPAPTAEVAPQSVESSAVTMNQSIDASPVPMFPRAVDAAQAPADTTITNIIDLKGASASADAVLTAILGQSDGALVECPVRPPMCPASRLAVTRDRELILIAFARQGLSELRAIGEAYRWLNENCSLIAMAIPQFAVDLQKPARLRLLIDHADSSAAVLQPLLQSDRVTVQACRQLRWGDRTGLFLEAA